MKKIITYRKCFKYKIINKVSIHTNCFHRHTNPRIGYRNVHSKHYDIMFQDLVKKIAWIRSHHLHLQWKFKLLAGKFIWGPEILKQNIAGWYTICFQKFVDNARQFFAFTPQAKFPALNLNFYWRWRLPFKKISTLNICIELYMYKNWINVVFFLTFALSYFTFFILFFSG